METIVFEVFSLDFCGDKPVMFFKILHKTQAIEFSYTFANNEGVDLGSVLANAVPEDPSDDMLDLLVLLKNCEVGSVLGMGFSPTVIKEPIVDIYPDRFPWLVQLTSKNTELVLAQ